MTTQVTTQSDHATAFERMEKGLPGAGSERIRALRREALARFRAVGFPTPSHKDWKGTDVAPIARTPWEPVLPEEAGTVAPADVDRLTYADDGAYRVVLVDGHFRPELTAGTPPAGVRVRSLRQALEDDPAAVEPHLAQHAAFHEQAFLALNTAYVQDGAFVEIEPGAVVRVPIHVAHVQTRHEAPRVVHARTLVVARAGSEATLVESYAGPAGARYFTNAVTEIALEANARVERVRLQRESEAAYHVSTTQIAQKRDSSYGETSLNLGGALVRNDVDSRFEEPGGETRLDGLFVTHGKQHVDVHTWLDHAAPRCASRETYNDILDGASRGIFNGTIVVRPDAQKTDAKQTNKNLLLSRQALVDSNPQLEIWADDVKCTHGSTTGQLDDDQVFYLRSRGIPEREARTLLTLAFARDVLDRVKLEALRATVDAWLQNRLEAQAG